MLLNANGILNPNNLKHCEYLVVTIASYICELVQWSRQKSAPNASGCVETLKKKTQTAPWLHLGQPGLGCSGICKLLLPLQLQCRHSWLSDRLLLGKLSKIHPHLFLSSTPLGLVVFQLSLVLLLSISMLTVIRGHLVHVICSVIQRRELRAKRAW